MKTKIRELRSRLKMTQQELADRVHVRRETVVFLEQGKYMPSLRLAYDVAQVFEEPIENVFMLNEGENQ